MDDMPAVLTIADLMPAAAEIFVVPPRSCCSACGRRRCST